MAKNSNINKIGIVAMPRISVGGGFAHAAIDLINTLNDMGKKVYLLTPFGVDFKKIESLYGPIKLEKAYPVSKFKAFFCREDLLGRKLIKKEFKQMAKEVDLIIDLDGGVLHNYLPKGFNRNNYVIWRLSCINPETHKLQQFTSWKIIVKKFAKKIIRRESDIPRNVKIYPMDEWTKQEIVDYWKIDTQKCVYPVKLEEFNSNNKKKKNQVAVLGRIAPNKSIHDSVKIFYNGTKEFPNYNLVILGGMTPDSVAYIKKLRNLIKEMGIEKRVKIIPDPSSKKIGEVLSESKILIDSQKGVSLTITSIEALAVGCVVIARKNGGTYKEVLMDGKYGLGFDAVQEGSNMLNKVLKNKSLDNKKSLERARFFSSDNFRKRVGEIINGR